MTSDNAAAPILSPLPECLAYSCMAQLSQTQIVLTGGSNSVGRSYSTYFYNPMTNTWTKGPDMLTFRLEHACGIIKDSNNIDTVIIVGGWDGFVTGNSVSTTEVYNRASNTWTRGPDLPYGVHTGQIIQDPDSGIVYVAGNTYATSKSLNTVLYLASASSNWIVLKQELFTGRINPMVIQLPYTNSYTDCSAQNDIGSVMYDFALAN